MPQVYREKMVPVEYEALACDGPGCSKEWEISKHKPLDLGDWFVVEHHGKKWYFHAFACLLKIMAMPEPFAVETELEPEPKYQKLEIRVAPAADSHPSSVEPGWRRETITATQVMHLRRLGATDSDLADVAGLTYTEAEAKIEELRARKGASGA